MACAFRDGQVSTSLPFLVSLQYRFTCRSLIGFVGYFGTDFLFPGARDEGPVLRVWNCPTRLFHLRRLERGHVEGVGGVVHRLHSMERKASMELWLSSSAGVPVSFDVSTFRTAACSVKRRPHGP